MAERYDTACPSCRMGALLCIGKEMRVDSPCCADCRAREVQRPLHVWVDSAAVRGQHEGRDEK